MKIAHLILTHKNPAQLERLIRALDHPGFDFYIHLDKKTDASPFLYLAQRKNVSFIQNRTPIYWAAFGTIQATLNGFREILPKEGYDYINVISGQDFPLKSAAEIYRYIQQRQGKEFITCESIDGAWSIAAPRVRTYSLDQLAYPRQVPPGKTGQSPPSHPANSPSTIRSSAGPTGLPSPRPPSVTHWTSSAGIPN